MNIEQYSWGLFIKKVYEANTISFNSLRKSLNLLI